MFKNSSYPIIFMIGFYFCNSIPVILASNSDDDIFEDLTCNTHVAIGTDSLDVKDQSTTTSSLKTLTLSMQVLEEKIPPQHITQKDQSTTTLSLKTLTLSTQILKEKMLPQNTTQDMSTQTDKIKIKTPWLIRPHNLFLPYAMRLLHTYNSSYIHSNEKAKLQ